MALKFNPFTSTLDYMIGNGTNDQALPVWDAASSQWIENPDGLIYTSNLISYAAALGQSISLFGSSADTSASSGSTSNGGAVICRAGDGSPLGDGVTGGKGGAARLRAGATYGSGAGANVVLTGGSALGTGDGGNIQLIGGSTVSGAVGFVNVVASQMNMSSTPITNVLDPTNPQDAATKNYVDAHIGGGVSNNATRGAPTAITAAGGISALGVQREQHFIVGNAGAVTITANPQISAGSTIGQELYLVGTHDTNTVTISHGTGLELNGACVLKNGSRIYLMWDGSLWGEVSRNDI